MNHPKEGEKRVYAALLVFESSCSNPDYLPLYEETVSLVLAPSDQEARAKAYDHGRQRETSYHNADGQLISWSLKHVVDVKEVEDHVSDGAEIYTRHFRDYSAYRAFEVQLSNNEL
ncbi:DUF4288 domain-containing protein [Sciscionella marina]|uniref:DUF4288 domain-containing protein n=1 Tax=Sciscionella marina TaxID=508770 RepID=UPI000A04F295|nr:DUF4288 domain-containing protein [Sciscionella marina]